MRSLLPVAILVVALSVLAGLQYQWIGEVSLAERQRLENGLRDASDRFSRDFAEELSRVVRAVDPRGPLFNLPADIVQRYVEAVENSRFPNLFKGIYFAEPAPGGPMLRRLEGDGSAAEVATPAELRFPEYMVVARPQGAIVIELDRNVLAGEVLPDMTEQHFGTDVEQNFQVAVRDVTRRETVYSSGNWETQDFADADYTVNLGWAIAPQPRPGFRGGPSRGRGGFRRAGPEGGGPPQGGGPPRGVLPSDASLQLLASYQRGSLESAVAQLRRRNMAVSFGILVVLAAAAFTVIRSSARARTLGKMQVEFAAGVSHELRTPLAVIQSAAHNLQTGVVHEPAGVVQYANLVQDEARRLSNMVEQVMAYAETQSGKRRFDLSAVDIRDVIDEAVKNTPAPRDIEFNLQQRISQDLPLAYADPMALSQCIQNLLSNALKYGRTDNIVNVEIEGIHRASSGMIQLAVTDSGSGVPAEDIKHLFDAFHRGANVQPGIPGNGLGLHLVRKTIESMGGSVEYASNPKGGASFTLNIPVAKSL